MQRTVAKAEQPKFTILLRMRIAVRVLSKSSAIFSARFAFLFPSSAHLLSLIVLAQEKAVSAQEQKEETKMSKKIIIEYVTIMFITK